MNCSCSYECAKQVFLGVAQDDFRFPMILVAFIYVLVFIFFGIGSFCYFLDTKILKKKVKL
jgi:hypothetical protein